MLNFFWLQLLACTLCFFLSACALVQDNLQKCAVETVSETGVMLWYNQPSAIFYKGQYERTYFAWVTSRGEVQIRYYDHQLNGFSSIITLHNWGKADDHAAPSLYVVREGKNKGRIVVAFSFHSSSLLVRYSKSPEEITQWADESIVYESRASYPRLIELPNRTLALFFRSHPLENASSSGWLSFMTSQDNGESWGNYTKLIDFGENAIVYAGPIATMNQRIAVAWTIFDIQDKRFRPEVFAAYSDDSGKTWVSYDGTLYTTFIDNSISSIVSDNSSEQVRVWDISIQPKESLSIAYVRYFQEYQSNTNEMNAYVATVQNGHWQDHFVGIISESYYAGGFVFDPLDNTTFYFSRMHQGKPALVMQRANQDVWVLEDQGSFQGGYVRPQIVTNFSSELKLVWIGVGHYSSYKEFDTAILTLICEP